MKRLADVEAALARHLLDRLAAVSVSASALPMTTYRGAPHPSGLVTVWVADASDLAAARRVLDEFLAEIGEARTQAECPHCGDDLRGHHGADRCPECGEAVRAPAAAATCGRCGEEVPETFAVCWNRGAEMPGCGAADPPRRE